MFIIVVLLVLTGNTVQSAPDKTTFKPKGVANREKLAVLDMDAKYGIDTGLAQALSVILRDSIDSFGDYMVMSREDLQAVASREQLLQALGCGENGQCLIDFGRAIGTRFMVAGSISKLGNTYSISIRMLDTKGDKAGVIKRASDNCKCTEDDLIGTVQKVSARLMGKEMLEQFMVREAAEKESLLPPKNIQPVNSEETASNEEQARAAEEQRKVEEAEKAKQAVLDEEKRQADEKKRITEEQARIAEETKKIEEAEKAKQAALDEEKRQADEKKRITEEQARIAEETKKIEEAEKAKQAVLDEEKRQADEKKRITEEQARIAEETKKIEEVEKVKQAALDDEKRQAAKKKKIAEEQVKNAPKQKNEIVDSGKITSTKEYPDEPGILLRKEKVGIIGNESLRKMIVENKFYEKNINPNGSFNNLFVAQSAEVVLDKRTGLMWQRDGSADELSFYRAKKYVQELNEKSFGGFSDWRLPTIEELASLIKKNDGKNTYMNSIFLETKSRYWSIDITDSGDDIRTEAAWVANFVSGNIVKAIWPIAQGNIPWTQPLNEENYVRAVRTASEQKAEVEAEKPPDERHHKLFLTLRKDPKNLTEHDLISFIKEHNFFEKDINPKGVFRSGYDENGDGTVTDRSTGLMWQKSGTTKSMTIYEAQSYINDLNEQKYCGDSDWRLPTLVELASLLRENQVGGLYIDTVFARTQRKLWSSDVSNAYDGQSGGYDTNFILNLEKGSFARAIFRKFNKPRSQSSDAYCVNDENYARAVRSCK